MSKTNLTTEDGLRIYDLSPSAADLTAIAGPEGLDLSTIDMDALPAGCRWVTDAEWSEACERAEAEAEECICEHTDSFCPQHNGTGCETGEIIRHGSFEPIVWDRETGETRCATQHDLDTLEVGDDLTDEEEASISE